MGTPAYMPPEQAAGDTDAVGPAADVYALGAILYELLTGRQPYIGNAIEVLAQVGQGPPQPVRSVQRGVPRGLAAVCKKAMARDIAGRYATAGELAADVERWLADEPVTAEREPLPARLARWARRNRTLTAAGALFLLALAVVASVTAALKEQARKDLETEQSNTLAQKQAAETNLGLAQVAEGRANREAREARENLKTAVLTNHFLTQDLLGQPSERAGDRRLTVEEAVDRAAGRVEQAFRGDPASEWSVRHAVGDSYIAMGRYEKARPQVEAALRLARQAFGEDNEKTLYTMNTMAALLADEGNLPEAEALCRQTLEAGQRSLGADNSLLDTVSSNLCRILRDQGRLAEAEPQARQLLEHCLRKYGPDDPKISEVQLTLAQILQYEKRWAEAEGHYRSCLAAGQRLLDPLHPDLLNIRNNLAVVFVEQGKSAEAAEEFRAVLVICRQVLGPEHPNTLQTEVNLAGTLLRLGRAAEAVPLLREALPAQRKALPEKHLAITRTLAALGDALSQTGAAKEGEPLLRECLSTRREVLPAGDWQTSLAESLLGGCLVAQRRFEEAEPMLVGSYQVLHDAADVPPERVRSAAERVIRLYDESHKPEQAAVWRKKLAELPPATTPAKP
jgi:non-specific serine/threonine protein kinase/serine/threonine-protein kinase